MIPWMTVTQPFAGPFMHLSLSPFSARPLSLSEWWSGSTDNHSGRRASIPMKVRRPFCSGCSTATRLLLLGAACLIVVVLTHVAEALQVFAFMGWGQLDSAGHYVDLASAIVGCTLLVAALVVVVLDPRKNVRHKR